MFTCDMSSYSCACAFPYVSTHNASDFGYGYSSTPGYYTSTFSYYGFYEDDIGCMSGTSTGVFHFVIFEHCLFVADILWKASLSDVANSSLMTMT